MVKCSTFAAIRHLAHHQPCLAAASPAYSSHIVRSPAWLRTPFGRTRPFSTSATHEAERSYYDILQIPPDVSRKDLKKRFYELSKSTHPDMNRHDPKASERFAEVSEAYAVLANEEKRKKYDRDIMPNFSHTRSHRSERRDGRQQSGTYAGSRAPTGLSKRRGTFRGPPPSFYAQSGQSANPDKEEYARREQQAYDAGQAGRFDPSQYATAGRWDPDFNPDPVYKTQTAEDVRRQNRRAAEMAAAQAYAEEAGNFWARFIMVSAVVAFGVGIGTMINRMSATPRGGILNGDGSKRGQRQLAAVK